MTGLGNCVSIHDVPVAYTEEHITEFIEQYVRRYERLIEAIRSNQKIVFIRWGAVTTSAAKRFVAAVKNINERCPFMLVILDEKDTPLKHCILRMKLRTREVLPTDVPWHSSHYFWEDLWAKCTALGF